MGFQDSPSFSCRKEIPYSEDGKVVAGPGAAASPVNKGPVPIAYYLWVIRLRWVIGMRFKGIGYVHRPAACKIRSDAQVESVKVSAGSPKLDDVCESGSKARRLRWTVHARNKNRRHRKAKILGIAPVPNAKDISLIGEKGRITTSTYQVTRGTCIEFAHKLCVDDETLDTMETLIESSAESRDKQVEDCWGNAV